ncbi:T9SS type A sorting domain-containing protein [Flavobacterium sp. LM4]|uniref:T9SS type A sorting domain-containing protein n=1 Tax=Flavobacterium sp. LM4 TaxID=1938609 RepID=UPI0009939B0E|nr:T9SS type A sorting domain-containing protein [Flavobacterium sp. LM4]OOV19568.1 hypothetical protein BXU10_07935 [Flavobacterium sp. LM4]
MKKIIQIIVLLLSLQLWAQTKNKVVITSLDMAKMQLNENHSFYNPEKGFLSCKKAAEEEAIPKAMNMLAILYSDGVGTEQNQELALSWFLKAAEAGYAKAWFNVGTMHREGLGTPQDFKKAFEYYSKGAALKATSSVFGKGYMLYKGLGCQQDYKQAFELFKESSQYGSLGSMYLLGICYRNGYGTPKDLVAAKQWLTKAANYGYEPAQNEMMEAEPEFADYKQTLTSYSKKKETHPEAKNHFEAVKHQINNPETLDGNYTGYIVTYDWSGQHIIAKEPLTVDLKSQSDGTFSGTWTENDKTSVDLHGKITDTEVLFDDTAYSKIDHYSAKKPTEFVFKNARLQTLNYQGTHYLAGNLQLWSVRQNEPEKPMYISLVKNKQDTGAPSLKNDPLVIYPNPFNDSFSFNLRLEEKTAVDIALYSMAGTVLYTEKLSLPAGNHTHTIAVNVADGSYILKVNYNNNSKSTIVIKSKL